MRLKSICAITLGAATLLVDHSLASAAVQGKIDLIDKGSGVFDLFASGFVNVQGVHCKLTYDTAGFSNFNADKGSLGSWTAFLPHDSKAGLFQVAMLSTNPVAGSGVIAMISSTTSDKGGCIAYSCSLSDESGTAAAQSGRLCLSATSKVDQGTITATDSSVALNRSDTNSSTGGKSGTTGGAVDAGGKSGNAVGNPGGGGGQMPGVVYLGGETSSMKDEAPASPPESIETASESSIQPLLPGDPEPEGENGEAREPVYSQVVTPPSSPPILDKYISYKSILAQFKEYHGEITPKSLTGIFSVPVAATIRQDPPIFINEGNASLEILVDVEGAEKSAPNFALRGASLKSLKKDAGKRWIVEAMPEVGRLDATLTIVNGERMMDYPLTIAPRADVNIDKKGSVDEADIKLFLSQRGTEKAPAFDINGDGKRDYVDDYIFTANYLVATGQKK